MSKKIRTPHIKYCRISNERKHIFPGLAIIQGKKLLGQPFLDIIISYILIIHDDAGPDQSFPQVCKIVRNVAGKKIDIVIQVPSLDTVLPRAAKNRMYFTSEQGWLVV